MYWRRVVQREVQNILRSLLTRESTDVITLDYLAVIAPQEQFKNMVRSVLTIRRRNTERLKWVYFQITGEYPEFDQETFARPDTFEEGIEEEAARQSTRIMKIRNLFQQIDDSYVQQILYQIMNDEYMAMNQLELIEQQL